MATKREKPLQGVARVWFRYLQLAVIAKETIAWERYAQWGTPEELETLSFNKWWKLRGADLFTPKPSEIELIDDSGDAIVVSIPLTLTRDQVFSQLSELLAQHSSQRSSASSLAFAPTGRVNTDALMRYQRMLEIDLNPKTAGQPFKKKLSALQERYAKNEARLKKQQATMRAKGSRKRLNLPKLDKLKGREKESKQVYVFTDERVAHRWLTQAKIIMKNVASGQFPGEGYYQRKGEASLGTKLKSK